VIDTGREHDHITLEALDPDPPVVGITYVEVPTPVDNEPNFLIVMDVLEVEGLDLLLVPRETVRMDVHQVLVGVSAHTTDGLVLVVVLVIVRIEFPEDHTDIPELLEGARHVGRKSAHRKVWRWWVLSMDAPP